MSHKIAKALRARLDPRAWGLLFDVGNSTGFGCDRHADALAMSLWPSRGLDIHGYEFKDSRMDWVRERDNPAKADAIAKYCDFWWLCVVDRAIVQPGELPRTWGLMDLGGRKGGLVVVIEATRLEPEPLNHRFLAALICKVAEPQSLVDAEQLARERKQGYDEAVRTQQYSIDCLTRELDDLRKRVADFESSSGVSIGEWGCQSGTQIGKAVHLVLSGGLNYERLLQLRMLAESIIQNIDGSDLMLPPACASTADRHGYGPDPERSSDAGTQTTRR